MNLMTRTRADLATGRIDIARLRLAIDLASRTVAPLWPLDGAIAVNPLAGFETLPFDEAVRAAATRFDARPGLSLELWRQLSARGTPSRDAVRDAAIAHLGGFEEAFRLLGPDVTLLDCLMARLFDLPVAAPLAPAADPVAAVVADLCAAFFDRGVAALAMPGQARGLFAAGLALLLRHPGLKRARPCPDLPDRPLAALALLVDALGIADAALDERLAATIARLPGWAGHLRWRTDHADTDLTGDAPASMADLVALLLLGDLVSDPFPIRQRVAAPAETRSELAVAFGRTAEEMGGFADLVAGLDDADLALIFQRAAETEYRDRLVDAILATPAEPRPAAEAAFVFCIDVRSEPIRRAIEATGPYDTIGYAGFFGLPVAIHAPGRPRQWQLPVLVAPQHDLALVAAPGSEAAAERAQRATRRTGIAAALFSWLKSGSATAYATAEATGWLAGAAMVARTLAPLGLRRWRRRRGEAAAFAPTIEPHGQCGGLDHGARVAYARALFALTGLDPQTPLIVLTGHRGETINNPYAAALDCGACAGHGGAPNARAMAAILNDAEVRRALALPDHGYALAAEHNTTTDEITLFGTVQAPARLQDRIARIERDLAAASALVRRERAARLERDTADLTRGAAHWAEVRPEWGLTGNAAFIVATRDRTRAIDLDGRAFLHSYDWRSDPDGDALATILTAPMVVAQWINCQYLFSTIDNDRYGAGDKIVHNPVGRIGVLRGNGGDLAIGLPRQSLFHDDGCPAHVPQRLLTIVEAPADRIAAVIEAHPVLQRLFGNEWVQLIAIDPETGSARRWRADGEVRGPSWFPRPDAEQQ